MSVAIGDSLEKDLLPLPDRITWNAGKISAIQLTLIEKIEHYVCNFFKFVVHLLKAPLSLCKSSISLIKAKEESPKEGVLRHFGFATSMYQDSGLGTVFAATPFLGECDWNEWLQKGKIEGEDRNYSRFFFDILRNQEAYIQILKSQNVTAHRFSLEWAVIEPSPGHYDFEAIHLYKEFIQALKRNGIEPYVTLHHFVSPKWFKENGGFLNLDQIEIFKNHALQMMAFFPEVIYWMPFNEINVDAFQKMVRGVYPPGREGDIVNAGRLMRSMLIAHCLIYQEAKAKWPEKQIGSTHQWLKFEPLNGNLLEQAICYFLSKITHYACYDFFKTGQFSLELPGISNVQFAIPQEEFARHNGFSDFIGVQFYGLPRLMAGFNGGEEYPGFGIQNYMFPILGTGLTFGSTCPKGGVVQSFGPSFYPESLETCLREAVELIKPFPGKTVVISETGCDARVWKFGDKEWTIDTQVQKEYFEQIFPILERFKSYISALFLWTLADGQEWERGDTPILNLGKMHRVDGEIQSFEPHPAAEFLKTAFAEKVPRSEIHCMGY